MKIVSFAAACCFVCTTAAHAQMTMTTVQQPPSAFAEPIIRVSSTFRTLASSAEGQQIADAKTQETARKELYRMAESECVILTEVYKGECRLGTITINPVFTAPNAPISSVVTATAIFEIRRK